MREAVMTQLKVVKICNDMNRTNKARDIHSVRRRSGVPSEQGQPMFSCFTGDRGRGPTQCDRPPYMVLDPCVSRIGVIGTAASFNESAIG